MSSDNERDRGILTKADRQYLRGEKEFEYETSEHHRREDIRDRIRDSLKDVSLILEHLSDEDLQKAVEAGRFTVEDDIPVTVGDETPIGRARFNPGEEGTVLDRDIERGLYDMLLLLYRVMLVEGRNTSEDEYRFSQLLEYAHEDAVTRYKPDLVVQEVDHTIDTWDRESLANVAERKYKRDEHLTGWEVQALLATERVPDDELGEYVRQSIESSGRGSPEATDEDLE